MKNFNNQPVVSVIMSVKDNIKNYLQQSIESILNQNFKNFEFIIIADGSNKETTNVLDFYNSKDDRIILIKQSNKGLTNSLNKAILASKTDYILRQDFDDISNIDRISEQYKFMNENPKIAVCGTSCLKINDKNNIVGNIKTYSSSLKIKKILFYFNPIIHPTIIFRKKIVKKFNFYNLNYKVSQDYELWSKISKDHKITNLNKYLVKLRVHHFSISANNNFQQRKNSLLINIKHKFNEYENKIDEFINIDINKININVNDTKLNNFINSRKYVLFYDKIKTSKILFYNLNTIYQIFDYYVKRPKYLILRLLKK